MHYIALYSGRLDRKIEFPLPNEESRAHILRIHSRKMNVNSDTNYEELARCTDNFNGAQLKAVCVEAGMIALRRGATELSHEDYMEGLFCVYHGMRLIFNLFSFSSCAFLLQRTVVQPPNMPHTKIISHFLMKSKVAMILKFYVRFIHVCLYTHNIAGILEVQAKKKTNLIYYA